MQGLAGLEDMEEPGLADSKPQGSTWLSASPGLGLQLHGTMPSFLSEFWGSSSEPHVLGKHLTELFYTLL